MKLEDLELGPRFHARLVGNEALTPPGTRAEVRELTLELIEEGFTFSIGQSVAVLLAGPHDFGQSHHVRLYSIASTPDEAGPGRITICVRRCHYVDPYSGERYRGIASNHLCDLPVGSELLLAGPVGLPFVIPEDPATPLLMVGLGTGVAPFRALLRYLFEERGGWQGKVRLFHGARVGLESVYRERIADYQSQASGFEAVEVLSSRPAWDDPADLSAAIVRHEAEVWALLEDPAVHVYIAGLTPVAEAFEEALAGLAGSREAWARRKADLVADGRWMELLY
ncbi:MAG: oxidoreductase [Gammaproteobacteria bacterium]|nr:oxidoreductase [Gammaproteobacteria bacterium]